MTAQNLEIKHTEFKENKLLVHYALTDSIAGRSFTVRLYSSKDNFLNPLEAVSGDVGLEENPGPDNTIVWDVQKEFGPSYEGKISLEIRSRIFIPFINSESINQYKVFRRGRKYNITWTGGSPQNVLVFDVYKGERKMASFPNLANVGHYALEFPLHIRPGKGYRFKISDAKNKEDIVFTNQFRIKRKFPLILKIIPTIIVGTTLYLLLKPKAVVPNLPANPDPPSH